MLAFIFWTSVVIGLLFMFIAAYVANDNKRYEKFISDVSKKEKSGNKLGWIDKFASKGKKQLVVGGFILGFLIVPTLILYGVLYIFSALFSKE